jgi:high-affinity nickel-transport protein
MPDLLMPLLALGAAGAGVLTTGLLLGVRHGFDWDHIAAITDITSTTATAEIGADAHDVQHATVGHVQPHLHGGITELHAHDAGPGAATATMALAAPALTRARLVDEERRAIVLGTLYALGHALVVVILGLAALAFGTLLPAWVDPIMGRIVGLTLLILGVWVFYSLWQFARHGRAFRLRSRWMLAFDATRYGWRRFQARLHGHEHHDPMEMSSYGRRTAFGVGMIHGVGAETGSQVLIIAAVGGASAQGLGVPMLFAFVLGLLIANTLIVVISATGFVASQFRQPLYIAIGLVAGTFSVVVGLLFLFGAEAVMPDLERFFSSIGA